MLDSISDLADHLRYILSLVLEMLTCALGYHHERQQQQASQLP